MNENVTYIAGSKTPDDWRTFRTRLVGNSNRRLWEQAFDEYFCERLKLRYLNPIRILQENGTLDGEGFSIVAILCTLVEFLETTIRGLKYRYVRNEEDLGLYEYCWSGGIFVDFLSGRNPFSEHFDEDLAVEFYKNIRCGLLHEAQTKGGWRIRAISPQGKPVDKNAKIVFRDDFKAAFERFMEDYKNDLLGDAETQEAFIRKFDFICEGI